MKGKDAVARILEMEAVECLTCFPDNAIIDAAATLGTRPILARTERVAVNIADGYVRVSDGKRIAATALQYAGGIENAFAGISQAYGDASPVLLLPSGYERCEQGVPPNFQAIQSYRSVTKWAEMVNFADRIPQAMQRAFNLLRSGKPGPVMLEIPTDVLEEELPNEALQYIPVKSHRSQGDPHDVRAAVRILLGARAPVLVVGQGIFYAQACEELKEFVELVQVPVLTTLNAKSAFPENHPLALGTGGRSRPCAVDHFLVRSDVVFGIGTSFTRSTYTVEVPPGKTMVQVTNCEDDLNKDYAITQGVLGDAKLVLRQLIDEAKLQLGPNSRPDGESLKAEIRAMHESFLEDWLPRLTSDDRPISPYRVIWDLMHTVDRRRTILTHDSGNPRDQMVPFYQALVPHGYIGWGKTTQLGTGLGLAMGAKLAKPDHLCVNFMGDAAFGMVGLDFETAVRMQIPILTVLINNSTMGGYQKFLAVSNEKFSTRHLSGNFSKVAEGLGGYTERVEEPHDLVLALRRCIAEVDAGRPALLEVITREEPVLALGPSSRYQ